MRTNFEQWEQLFDKQALAALDASNKIIDKGSLVLYNRITQRTPIGDPSLWKWPAHKDYKPGTLRASWTIEKNGKTIIIYNEQPYAERVEYGWSTQAPNGMLRISVSEWPAILEDATREFKI